MTDKKTPLKTKIASFVKKHDQDIITVGIIFISSYAAIVIDRALTDMNENKTWNEVENHDFFADADVIARTKNGRFIKLKEIDEEEYDKA